MTVALGRRTLQNQGVNVFTLVTNIDGRPGVSNFLRNLNSGLVWLTALFCTGDCDSQPQFAAPNS